ncbi:hypothetical protein DFS34DRAFT_652845 [Phlyctochytrium arcticum]|nr:hypothetical protein DFS34DRAFT_652845 [Phlyctochytrium arcticum]
MGARSSKSEPIIIYNEPDVAVQFTPNLLRKLDSQPPDRVLARFGGIPQPPAHLGDSPFIPPHDATSREQSTNTSHQENKRTEPNSGEEKSNHEIDQVIRQRVQREVELHQQKRLAHEQRSADQVRREAEDLLQRQKLPPKFVIDQKAVEAEKAVAECYRGHSNTPLDCWREVENLKEAAKRAQKEFVDLQQANPIYA